MVIAEKKIISDAIVSHKAAVKPSFDEKNMYMTLCINMRVQRVPRTPSTTPAGALLSTADEPGSLSYICVQCCPARPKCGM